MLTETQARELRTLMKDAIATAADPAADSQLARLFAVVDEITAMPTPAQLNETLKRAVAAYLRANGWVHSAVEDAWMHPGFDVWERPNGPQPTPKIYRSIWHALNSQHQREQCETTIADNHDV